MVIGTGISLWRYLAQSQVDSQTHAERRIIYLFIATVHSPPQLLHASAASRQRLQQRGHAASGACMPVTQLADS